MVETITYARMLREDIDLGVGTRTLRLQDGALHTLQQISGHLYLIDTVIIPATADQAQLTATFNNPNNTRVHGVTILISDALGTTRTLRSA